MEYKVATVQMVSNNNDFEGNRIKAEKHILEAIKREAKLILLPEFALAGYSYTDDFWKMAEPLYGRTYKWLISICKKHNVYIGTCILENNGNHFYDTFLLVGPKQNEFWHHRKIEAPSYESYLFKGFGINSNVFATTIGRIGVVICFDSAKSHTLLNLKKEKAEIVLIAYSYPRLPQYFSIGDRNNWYETFLKAPRIFANALKVPVVVSNKTGSFKSRVPIGLGDFNADFAGGTSIFDNCGDSLGVIAEGQTGILVSKLKIGKQNFNKITSSINSKKWLLPYRAKTKALMEFNRTIGSIRYRYSKKRKNALKVPPSVAKAGMEK